ncbi:unnamed protein product [Arabidopsis halleri]
MGREMKKIRRVELTKKVRVTCNFCNSSGSSFELRPHGQDQDALSPSMESELKRLRLLNRRLTGKDLDGLSFAELQSLVSQLKDVLHLVQNLKVVKKDDELLSRQLKGAVVKDGFRTGSSSTCSSPMQREFERRSSESMQSEFERLWLMNERMCGRDLQAMTFFELLLLEGRLLDSMNSISAHILGPRMDEMAWQFKQDDRQISLRIGSHVSRLSVSRKLRRLPTRLHRKKTMPWIR